MEIRKLGELCDVTTGNLNKENENPFGKYDFYVRSVQKLKCDKWTIDYDAIVIPGEGSFIPQYSTGKVAIHQRVYIIKSKNTNLLKNKYLYYWWLKNSNILYKNACGSTVKSLRKNNFLSPSIFLPAIYIQQQIINIIEPFEKIKKNILSKLEQLKNLYSKIVNNKFNYELMINNEIKFEKGVNFKKIKFSSNGITFINVSAINNKPNKYVDLISKNLINVNYGDVVISLDGTPGLVNNFLYGINGYGYKLVSCKYKNYELYFSLLNKYNQKVISKFSTGTTILHASKAKNQLVIMDFEKYKNVLEKIYEIEIKWKAINLNLYRIINNLIFKYLV